MRFNPFSRRALFSTLIMACLATLTLVTGCSKFDNSQSTLNGPQVTAKFFDAQFTDAAGKPVDLTTLRGKTVVINFWSTWCPPCVEEMPLFSEAQTAYKDKNVVFVGIAADQADNVKPFLQKNPVNYLIAVGGQPAFELSQQLGNRHDAVPFTVIINAKEGITSRRFGIYTRKDLDSDLAKALK